MIYLKILSRAFRNFFFFFFIILCPEEIVLQRRQCFRQQKHWQILAGKISVLDLLESKRNVQHVCVIYFTKNQVTIPQFLEYSVIAFWTIYQESRPMAVLLKSFQLCQGYRSVPPFQGEKLNKMRILFGNTEMLVFINAHKIRSKVVTHEILQVGRGSS